MAVAVSTISNAWCLICTVRSQVVAYYRVVSGIAIVTTVVESAPCQPTASLRWCTVLHLLSCGVALLSPCGAAFIVSWRKPCVC